MDRLSRGGSAWRKTRTDFSAGVVVTGKGVMVLILNKKKWSGGVRFRLDERRKCSVMELVKHPPGLSREVVSQPDFLSRP